jgi:hypothetical protein
LKLKHREVATYRITIVLNDSLAWEGGFAKHNPNEVRKGEINMFFMFDLTCMAFFGHNDRDFHCDNAILFPVHTFKPRFHHL